MTRRLLTLLGLLAALMAAASPALAQSPDEVAAEVRDRGYYVEPGLSTDQARISAAVARAGNGGVRLFVVVLDQDPPGGATTFAAAVLDRIGDGVVLVLSQTMVGMEAFDLSQSQVERALDAAAEAGSDEEAAEAVVDSLLGSQGGAEGGGGGKTGLIVLAVVVGGLVLLVVWAVRRQSRSAEQSRKRAIEEARGEIKAQLDAMADTILEISDKVSASASREDNTFLEQASRVFTEASEGYEAATDLAALAQLSDRLDEARWQMDAAAAIADDKPVPPRPPKEERSACFFDPTHSGPFEDARVETAAGARTVRVCTSDAEKLRQGRQPQPRMIQVGGHGVPSPAAPRSYGGGGWDWLDVFSVLVGGMGQARSYDWGRPRSGGWGWGSGGSGWRSSGSRVRTGSSSRSSSGGARTRVRAGRTRTRGR